MVWIQALTRPLRQFISLFFLNIHAVCLSRELHIWPLAHAYRIEGNKTTPISICISYLFKTCYLFILNKVFVFSYVPDARKLVCVFTSLFVYVYQQTSGYNFRLWKSFPSTPTLCLSTISIQQKALTRSRYTIYCTLALNLRWLF